MEQTYPHPLKNRKLVGLYPGTFDPITQGHLDIIGRALQLVDHLVIGIANNSAKVPLFSFEERVDMVTRDMATLQAFQRSVEHGESGQATIQVEPFEILLMNFAQKVGAQVIIRGLRAVSDFEYEFQMAGMNMCLNPTIETIFLMASDRHQFISSSMVKEVGRLNGDISRFVSPSTAASIRTKFGL